MENKNLRQFLVRIKVAFYQTQVDLRAIVTPSSLGSRDFPTNLRGVEVFPADDRALARCIASVRLEERVVGIIETDRLDVVYSSAKISAFRIWTEVP